MKIILAYDGSADADAAINDIGRAGLPGEGKALVLCVGRTSERPQSLPETTARKLQSQIPGWQISSESLPGPPEDVLLKASHWWRPDLLILGSNGSNGRVPLEILHQTPCGVRVVRSGVDRDGPVRVVIGNDGSKRAAAMIASVARRSWPADTEARVISVVAPSSESRDSLSHAAQHFATHLCMAGLNARGSVIDGDPRHDLVREAEGWNADTIFVGAHGLSEIDRFLLGSVSTAVVTRARSTVEVVR